MTRKEAKEVVRTARVIGSHAGCGGEVIFIKSGIVGFRACKGCSANTFKGDALRTVEEEYQWHGQGLLASETPVSLAVEARQAL